MKRTISISDFSFIPAGYGHYRITYKSPLSGKQWEKITCNMLLVDATKNSDNPKKKDLEELRRFLKFR